MKTEKKLDRLCFEKNTNHCDDWWARLCFCCLLPLVRGKRVFLVEGGGVRPWGHVFCGCVFVAVWNHEGPGSVSEDLCAGIGKR